MMRQLLLLATLALMGISVVGCEDPVAKEFKGRMTGPQVEALVSKNLQIGATRRKVVAFLRDHKMEYSSHSRSDPSDTIHAIYRNTGDSRFLDVGAEVMQFNFSHGRLSRDVVKEVMTGP